MQDHIWEGALRAATAKGLAKAPHCFPPPALSYLLQQAAIPSTVELLAKVLAEGCFGMETDPKPPHPPLDSKLEHSLALLRKYLVEARIMKRGSNHLLQEICQEICATFGLGGDASPQLQAAITCSVSNCGGEDSLVEDANIVQRIRKWLVEHGEVMRERDKVLTPLALQALPLYVLCESLHSAEGLRLCHDWLLVHHDEAAAAMTRSSKVVCDWEGCIRALLAPSQQLVSPTHQVRRRASSVSSSYQPQSIKKVPQGTVRDVPLPAAENYQPRCIREVPQATLPQPQRPASDMPPAAVEEMLRARKAEVMAREARRRAATRVRRKREECLAMSSPSSSPSKQGPRALRDGAPVWVSGGARESFRGGALPVPSPHPIRPEQVRATGQSLFS
ncbi:unnamed protein product [Chrysoparadoxa australica]